MEKPVNAFMRAVKNFSSWMDIRKRPEKSNGGLLLKSITEEQEHFELALDEYVKDFFLLNYLGREESVLDYAWIVQVGELSADDMVLKTPSLTITEAPGEFMKNRKTMALCQEGFVVIDELQIPEDRMVEFLAGKNLYRLPAEKKHIWNIFDEFALFLSLERFEGEKNKALVKRCFDVFLNPANSTEAGLKNAVINAVSGTGTDITADDIRIEAPGPENAYLADKDNNQIYELAAELNRDVNRKKKWDKDTWEHRFKELEYLPHIWDSPIDIYQDGTGQMDDLKVSLTGEDAGEGTTDVSVYGYEESRAAIDEYVRKNRIKRDIPLQLLAYRNEIKPETVQYRITASEAKELDALKVSVKGFTCVSGESLHNLEDIVTDSGDVTVIKRGRLEKGKSYRLKFRAESPYSEMVINKADFIEGDSKVSLLKEEGAFKKVNGSLVNSDVLLHADSINRVKNQSGFRDTACGMTLLPSADEGHIDIDITGMGGKYYRTEVRCDAEDITSNTALVKPHGFRYREESRSFIADDKESESFLEIEVSCREFGFMLAPADTSERQGSCVVTIYADGELLAEESGLWTKAKSFQKKLDKFSEVKIRIQKSGMYPVEIKDIKAVRYDISTDFDYGQPYISSFGKMLPKEENGKPNTLHLYLKAYGENVPVIEYVHIGSSLKNAVYETEIIRADTSDSRLSIDSSCRAELYEVKADEETLLEEDFVTTAQYLNKTGQPLPLVIDTGGFVTVTGSSKAIKSAYYRGTPVEYITLEAGECLDSLTVTGTTRVMRNSFVLGEVLGCKKGEKVYLSAGAEGFIIRNEETGSERLAVIKREIFDASADTFIFGNLPDWAAAYFVIDKTEDIVSRGNSISRNFQYAYASVADGSRYIAWNSAEIITSPTKGIPLVNTFSPILEEGRLMFYRIDEPVFLGHGAKALFEKRENGRTVSADWTLGIKPYGITVEADMEYENSESYNSDVTAFTETYSVSSSITLPNEVVVNGESEYLSKYIITPPEDMQISYASKLRTQEIIVEEDGFNKLYDSNIREIELVKTEGIVVPAAEYSLLGREGIIIWKTGKYSGKQCEIIYRYLQPKSLEYRDIKSLYDIAGYSVSAYKAITEKPLEFRDLSDGDTRIIDFGEHEAAKVVVRCSNLNFQARVEENVLRVKKINSENVAVVNAGFFYDDGEEYYLFNHMHEENIDGASAVKLWNVRSLGNAYKLISESTNHLKDSTFRGKHERVLCEIDFGEQRESYGISCLRNLTGCDSYNMWNQCDMDVSIGDGYNNLGLCFKPRSGNGYAVLDLKGFLFPGYILSFYASAEIKSYLLKAVSMDGDYPHDSVFAGKYMDETSSGEGFRSYIIPEDADSKAGYYLLIQGRGIVDDIISCPYEKELQEKELHRKNIDAIGLSVVEKVPAETEICLEADRAGCLLEGLQFRKDMTLETGSNVNWGLTEIYSLKKDGGAVISGADYNGELYKAEEPGGIMTIPDIKVLAPGAMASACIKVNDVLIGGYEGFNITVYGRSTDGGAYKKLASTVNTNLVRLLPGKIMPYIKIVIEMGAGKVINDVEVFARYAETEVPLRIRPIQNGTFISKVYDTGFAAVFSPKRMEGEADNLSGCRFFVRGARRDEEDCVWTDWYELRADEGMNFIKDPHVFRNYRLFQFRVNIDDERTKLKITRFVFEVL